MVFALLSLLFSGAIFGFFYAWVSSTMWGLDAVDPRVAIAAMQAMNASVRNAVFAPAFFGTPLVLLVTALANRRASGAAALAFAAAAVVYTLGGLILTLAVNVPMNEALAQVIIPEDRAEAAAIWAGYSPRWQLWNQIRTVASGLALLLAGWGTWRLGRDGGR
ncbi:anthrone oxygenase family protein [uncultured Paracoccus sp.]|uniref:anthrone oxygenase family protein n=1 Tax=uncultured Paracoccus sp. TaxID=189685 RepID=UPI00260CAB73|nr:anthrone oxygenase family protein [uncultured Paracoccus sp.]